MEDSTTVVAIRDIAAGEEITIDYATVNSGLNTSEGDNFECR
jgi:SET domain-containing protein